MNQSKSGRRKLKARPRKPQSQKAELVLRLDRRTYQQLKAVAAYDDVTLEGFAEQAVRTCIDAAWAAMEAEK